MKHIGWIGFRDDDVSVDVTMYEVAIGRAPDGAPDTHETVFLGGGEDGGDGSGLLLRVGDVGGGVSFDPDEVFAFPVSPLGEESPAAFEGRALAGAAPEEDEAGAGGDLGERETLELVPVPVVPLLARGPATSDDRGIAGQTRIGLDVLLEGRVEQDDVEAGRAELEQVEGVCPAGTQVCLDVGWRMGMAGDD